MLRLSMKPTGWFQIGWSAEVPVGGAKPLRYFGRDLVAFRGEDGVLHVLDAHCRHLGAHLGYESKVNGNCIACPYHGWEWDGDGVNTLVPYQDRPTRARLTSWPCEERNGIMWMWHDPSGGAPREGYRIPDPFGDFDEVPANEADFFGCYPHGIVNKPNEPIHPQLVLENSADCAHFQFTHGSPERPQQVWFRTDGPVWKSKMAFLSPKTKQPALHLYNVDTTIGVTAALFHSDKVTYRLVLTATPIDDERSDLRVSYFFPRNGVTGDQLPEALAAFAAQTEELFEQDARIWRHQAFVQKPVYEHNDRAGYSALRTWCEQFYEAPEGPNPIVVIESSLDD